MFDGSDPSSPVLMSHYSEADPSYITNLAVSNRILYASDFELGFRIFGITDSYSLVEIGRGLIGRVLLGFQVVDDLAYVASQPRGIQITRIQMNNEFTAATTTTTTAEETPLGIEIVFLGILVSSIYAKEKRNRKKSS